ncbi:MAG: nicotinamide-nucleotide amidohydrolase family protein [Nitrosomonas sp.]|nr:nicotinamide-nucleotide amidohydrolase family protein [Nitrosomonas sp.]
MIVDDTVLYSYAQQVGVLLASKGLKLVSAESCTGGWIGQSITAIAGSSGWYECGFITYSNQAKHRMLGVQATTLLKYGAISEQTTTHSTTHFFSGNREAVRRQAVAAALLGIIDLLGEISPSLA